MKDRTREIARGCGTVNGNRRRTALSDFMWICWSIDS